LAFWQRQHLPQQLETSRSLERNMRHLLRTASIGALTVGLFAAIAVNGAGAQNKALDQLKQGTSGGQTTGQTFDGGKTLTDTNPKGQVNVPSVGSGVSVSSGSTGGYSVSPSSGPATGKKTGSEPTKKN
jgi:hypothetical protein